MPQGRVYLVDLLSPDPYILGFTHKGSATTGQRQNNKESRLRTLHRQDGDRHGKGASMHGSMTTNTTSCVACTGLAPTCPVPDWHFRTEQTQA